MELEQIKIPPGFPDIPSKDGTTEEYYLNMGPQHPSTHVTTAKVTPLCGRAQLGAHGLKLIGQFFFRGEASVAFEEIRKLLEICDSTS